MATKLSVRAFKMIKAHEGLPTKMIKGVKMAVPYRDPIGIWTVGYGFITLNGKRVTGHTPAMTLDEVDAQFKLQLKTYIDGVLEATTVQLTPHQLGACTSFAYNLGVNAFQKSTLLKRINSCDWEDVEYQFSRWNKAGGKVLPGLTRRRKEEAELFMLDTRLAKHPTPMKKLCKDCISE